MKKLFCGVASLLLACGIAWAAQPVTVYDVGVVPDSPNKKVTVTYRLTETNAGVANVSVNISSNAGETWAVPALTYYPGSDVGPGIPANGTLRQLIWDARTDWNQQYSTQMMVRLDATAVEAQNAIYYVSGGKLYRMNPDGSAHTLLYTGLPKTSFMTMDKPNNRLLITSWNSGAILAYNILSGGSASTLYSGPGGGGQGVAYDAGAGKLVCGLYYNGVYAMNVRNSLTWTQLVTASALSPMIGQRGDLDVDPAQSNIYFRSAYNGYCDQCRWIWRVNYDGSGLTKIVQANDSDAMALDLVNGKIYYSDNLGEETIKRSNMDGSGVETVMTMPAAYSAYQSIEFELDVPGNKIYMYICSNANNWQDRAIARAALDGSNFEILKSFHDTGEGYGLSLLNR
jgi:hypothetical protein